MSTRKSGPCQQPQPLPCRPDRGRARRHPVFDPVNDGEPGPQPVR